MNVNPFGYDIHKYEQRVAVGTLMPGNFETTVGEFDCTRVNKDEGSGLVGELY
jgi:hypothetical protein